MAIHLYDSLERKLKQLKPAQPDGVFRFYNCGLTVYAPGHIGNFRTFVINDVLRRLLELEFGKDKVKHVRNLTDVDDRTVAQTKAEKRPLAEITKKWTDKFHADCIALNCLPPHAEPTATGYIREQVNMIEVLMEKGNAYRAADGSVYFKLNSFPEYGALSHIKERELKVTNAVADSDHKDSVSDFALWKAYKPEEDGDVKWPGPRGTGEGRPGWHIECSAMSKALLGDTIDLHTGGVDLLFPHHENEIAQSQCCNGTLFSHHWYHSEHLLVDGKKMSKSLGNYYTVDDIVAKGFSPMALRYALLSGHPRKQLNFTLDGLHAAEKAITQIRDLAHQVLLQARSNSLPLTVYNEPPEINSTWGSFDAVIRTLNDDINTPQALGEIFTVRNKKYTHSAVEPHFFKADEAEADFQGLRKVIYALGIKFSAPGDTLFSVPATVIALAEKRWQAKKNKDFAGADALRMEIATTGWSMLDGKDGYKLEPVKK